MKAARNSVFWYRSEPSLGYLVLTTEMPIEPCVAHIKQNIVSSFATTPAEFNLTARGQHLPRRSDTRNSADQSMSHRENLTELVRLRSSAFWELRRSIAENGEGFVRRMRVYEGSRSRQTIHLKVKEAEKRGRKRLSSKKHAAIHNSDNDDDGDDDDIQICSGDSSSNIRKFSFCGGRGHAMDDDNHPLDSPPSTWHMRSCPSCGSQCSSTLQCFFTPIQDSEQRFSSSMISSPPCSPSSTSPPSCGPLSHTTDDLPLPLLSTASCHRVVATLNLALANGAGSVEDYSPLWDYQSRFQTEYYDHGDLWH